MALVLLDTDTLSELLKQRNPQVLANAATALETDRTLITGNTAHYEWIPGLKLDDWRNP